MNFEVSSLAKRKTSKKKLLLCTLVLLGLIVTHLKLGLQFFFQFTFPILSSLIAIHIIYKAIAILAGFIQLILSKRKIDENKDWPLYTILLPLYKEPEVIHNLLEAIHLLDYPKNQIQVLLLIEHDDHETLRKIKNITTEPYVETIIIPKGKIKTKPQACNIGLSQTRGEFVVIYDAEDRPERDQLKKAATKFRLENHRTACLQACLNSYNSKQNIITKLWTLEYCLLFDFLLPGFSFLGMPVPLGGTSNHFRVQVLKKLGGWDPYNVTEDCDLGYRFYWGGYKVKVIQSTTWEEAPAQPLVWFKQRTRWLKGYIQTFVVHCNYIFNNPQNLFSIRVLPFFIYLGGALLSLSLTIPMIAVLIAWLISPWPLTNPDYPFWSNTFICSASLMLAANILFMLFHLMASFRRKQFHTFWAALFLPLYWIIISLVFIRALLQFILRPHYWEKTPHGKNVIEDKQTKKSINIHLPEYPKQKLGHVFSFVLLLLILIIFGITSRYLIRYTQTTAPFYCFEQYNKGRCEIHIEKDYSSYKGLEIALRTGLPYQIRPYTLNIDMVLADGEKATAQLPVQAVEYRKIFIPFDTIHWKMKHRFLDDWVLRRVRKLIIYIQELEDDYQNIDIAHLILKEKKEKSNSFPKITSIENKHFAKNNYDINIHLNKVPVDPFSPETFHIKATIQHEKLQRPISAQAFFHQDYVIDGGQYFQKGSPYWKLRLSCPQKGTYTINLQIIKNGKIIGQQEHLLNVKKITTISKVTKTNEGNFYKTNGKLYYPLGLNLAWPIDSRFPKVWFSPKNNFSTTNDLQLMKKHISYFSKNSISLIRIWSAPWWGGLEWNSSWPSYNGLTNFNLLNAWKLDEVFRHALNKNMQIEMVLGSAAETLDSLLPDMGHLWEMNPYNQKNSGIASSPKTFFTSSKVFSTYKKKLNYIRDRYSNLDNLFSYVIWNENNISAKLSTGELQKFSRRAAKELRNKREKHFLSTHMYFHLADSYYYGIDTFTLPELDYVQANGYREEASTLETIDSYIDQLIIYKKPIVISEMGGHAYPTSLSMMAHEIHNNLWIGITSPLAFPPLAWWWNMIYDRDLGFFYSLLADFIKGENLDNSQATFQTIKSTDHPNLFLRYRQNKNLLGWIYNSKTSISNNISLRGIKEMNHAASLIAKAHDAAQLPSFQPYLKNGSFQNFPTIKNVVFEVNAKPLKKYRIEIWDTWKKGHISRLASANRKGVLKVLVPSINHDLALKIIPI